MGRLSLPRAGLQSNRPTSLTSAAICCPKSASRKTACSGSDCSASSSIAHLVDGMLRTCGARRIITRPHRRTACVFNSEVSTAIFFSPYLLFFCQSAKAVRCSSLCRIKANYADASPYLLSDKTVGVISYASSATSFTRSAGSQ